MLTEDQMKAMAREEPKRFSGQISMSNEPASDGVYDAQTHLLAQNAMMETARCRELTERLEGKTT
jgi:hypothetical protein